MSTAVLGKGSDVEKVTEQALVASRDKIGEKEGLVLVEIFFVFFTTTIFFFFTRFLFSDSRELIWVLDF